MPNKPKNLIFATEITEKIGDITITSSFLW
jgi:hypothetical protein